MKKVIVNSNCIGCGACTCIAKEVFTFLINREKFNVYLAAKLAIDCANVFIDKLKKLMMI